MFPENISQNIDILVVINVWKNNFGFHSNRKTQGQKHWVNNFYFKYQVCQMKLRHLNTFLQFRLYLHEPNKNMHILKNLALFWLMNRELDGEEAEGAFGGGVSLQTARKSAEDHLFRSSVARPFGIEGCPSFLRSRLPNDGPFSLFSGGRIQRTITVTRNQWWGNMEIWMIRKAASLA